jgi:4'-phosphopantetheinyl transferase superfamily
VTLAPTVETIDLVVAGAPELYLLDARILGTDPAGLRQAARQFCGRLEPASVSRSYCHPLALVAGADRPLGVDIEQVSSWRPSQVRGLLTPEELEGGPLDDPFWATSLWSSKEALAKGLGDALDYDPRRVGAPSLWPNGRAGRWQAQMVIPAPGYVAWVCWTRDRTQA